MSASLMVGRQTCNSHLREPSKATCWPKNGGAQKCTFSRLQRREKAIVGE